LKSCIAIGDRQNAITVPCLVLLGCEFAPVTTLEALNADERYSHSPKDCVVAFLSGMNFRLTPWTAAAAAVEICHRVHRLRYKWLELWYCLGFLEHLNGYCDGLGIVIA
jgi:hypothetical protein